MKINDYKRSIKAKLSKRIFMNLGIFASFLLVTVLSLYAWSPAKESSAFDWTTVDGASPYVASLSGNDEIRISATPSASQAVFDQDDTLELTSTCPYGAAIYLNMDSSESNALSRTGSDEGIKTISATTGTALNDNSWGYSLDNGSTFLPMPLSTGTPVNIYNSEQVESNTEITVKYGIKIDSSIPSGYYSGNVLYSIIADPACAKYTLSFDTDGGTEIEDVLLTYGQTIDLPDYTTTKQGFIFDGWELVGSLSTTFDGSETDVDVNPGNDLEVELKAKWINPEPMQGFDCEELSIGDTVKLYDIRDDNVYTIRRLPEGNCWMTENLRIANKTITSADSNLPSGETYTIPASDLSAFNYNANTSAAYVDPTYGGYYNFYTVTAGWGGDNITGGNAPKDICPKGWRLPIGGDSTGEFRALYDKYKSHSLMRGDPGFILSGEVTYNGFVSSQGGTGYYWSSTVSEEGPLYMEIGTSMIYLGEYDSGYNGYSVHCVAKVPDPTMQTFDKTTLVNVGDSIELEDERDGNKYTVKKLADGNVWMTENLRLINKTISGADSDLPEGETWTIPASSASGFSTQDTNNAYFDSTYGGYYTFYTATAGTGGTSLTSGNAPSSICPKGWRLPTGGEDGEYDKLYDYYHYSRQLMRDESNFTFSGFVNYGGSVVYQGSTGVFWSSTVDDATDAYYMALESNSLSLYEYNPKYYGYSVRCMAKETMQTFDKTTLVNVGDSIELEDTRDGTMYTVKKLADGNVWMTENLRLINKKITYADSNLPSREYWIIPASDESAFTTLYNTDAAYLDNTYGGYYNFYTATAGWGRNNISSGNSPKDICPKRWRLPTGDSTGELNVLYNNYNSVALMQGDPGFTLSGQVNAGSVSDQGSIGYYWSSTVRTTANVYILRFNSSSVSPAVNTRRYYGLSVRCIAQ